jgi:prepilin-type N-terminal cleavage/methylation domain-containing protein
MISLHAQRARGFSIVELLIVIVVIAVLAAVGVAVFRGIQNRAQQSALQSEVNGVAKKLEIYRALNSVYPGAIDDCPSPAAANICVELAGGKTHSYQFNAQGGGGASINVAPSYHLTVFGDSFFAFSSSAEKTSSNEFVQYADLAPIIDRYGLKRYQLTFDIKSANAATASSVNVYFQNGSTTRYSGLSVPVSVTTEYTRKTITFTATLQNSGVAQALLAFYGTYGTGNIATIKNLQFQIAP